MSDIELRAPFLGAFGASLPFSAPAAPRFLHFGSGTPPLPPEKNDPPLRNHPPTRGEGKLKFEV